MYATPIVIFYSYVLSRISFFSLPITFLLIHSAAFSQSQKPQLDSTERFITVGFHKLFVSERGPKNAAYTIVFESGAGGTSKDWQQVRSMLHANIRSIAYDRAGLGRSEAGPMPRTMKQEVFELHQLLKFAGIEGPVILVGQSLGGLLVRMYTEQYGKNVVGVLLVDPTHESSVLGSMRYGGWVRLREKAVGKVVPPPQLKMKITPGYDTTADYLAEELQNIYLSSQRKPKLLKDRPLIILAAGKGRQPPGTPDEQWRQIRSERIKQLQDLTGLSGNSKFVLVPESGHMMHYDDPQIVAKSIGGIL